MSVLELPTDRQDRQTPLFRHPGPTRGDLEHQHHAEFIRLLDAWSQIPASSPFAGYGPNILTVVANTKAALKRNPTVYQALLLHVAPVFLEPDDHALVVIEVADEHG